ncbi:serine hydrolase domain-containing protein [Streptomyces sp. NPDC014734]|uniref:serine hydrolase domain-containing protein n=1 Tax=Streptomyces sp. NPDC014734 TaxID=3364886 RepID=UPI003700464B
MASGIRWAAAAAGVAAAGTGLAWLWRHQDELAMRRPVNEWTFTHMSLVLPTETVARSGPVHELPDRPRPLAGFRYEFRGARRTLAELHERTHTTGFAVLHRGALVHEDYPGRFAAPERRFQLFSLSKSVTSMLIGIALDEGAIGSVTDKVVSYCPELAGSAFDGPGIEDLLHMTSGAGGIEDYEDPDAPVNRLMGAVMGRGTVLRAVRSVEPAATPGTWFNYSTLDTQVLGWVLEAATGMPLARYATERLWSRIGAEHDAFYGLSRSRPRTAVGGGTFNATVRDLARVGLVMARGGRLGEVQVVPEAWVRRSRGMDLPHLEVGALGHDFDHYGYANQWWTLGGAHRAFTGLGIHGQYLWVDPEADVVVVKTSAWPTADDVEREAETFAALSALVAHLEDTD